MSELNISKRKKDTNPLNIIGASGTVISNGVISEEYNPDLEGLDGMDMWEKMRKSDAQCAAVLLVCELPLRSANWTVEPYIEEGKSLSPKDKEIAEFVREALFDKMNVTFDEFLVEVFTFLAFGFAVFEKVYKLENGKLYIKKLASRKQTTITGWFKDGVRQQTPLPINEGVNEGENDIIIPWSKIIVFTHKKEGDNYEGVSLLRPAHINFHYKRQLYKFDGVQKERQSVGIPVMYIPSDASDADKEEAQTIVNNVRVMEQTGVVIPGSKDEGWLFEMADMKAGGSNTNMMESIKEHNREISKVMLAQFLELGNTDSGSRSVGETMNEMFLMVSQAIGNYVASIISNDLVKELVDLNFDTEKYPKVKVSKIKKIDYEAMSSALDRLAGQGLITPTIETEVYLRDTLDLPAFEANSVIKKPDTTKTKTVKDPENKEKRETDKEFMELSQYVNNDLIVRLQNEKKFSDKKKSLKFNAFEKSASRPLTFAERKVNFTMLDSKMRSLEAKLEKEISRIFKDQTSDILSQIKSAVDGNDTKELAKIKAGHKQAIAAVLTEIQKEMFEVGKKTSANELDVQVPPTSKEIKGAMRAQNEALTNSIVTKQEAAAITAVTEAINKRGGDIKDVKYSQISVQVKESLNTLQKRSVQNLKTLNITGAVNTGRTSIYERYPKKIYAMQYSAILDDRTTYHCLSLDGLVVKKGSSEFYAYAPPQHYNCRSIWVAILMDELFKPRITGVPKSITPTKSLDTAKLLKNPVILKNSAAIGVIQQEINERKAKLSKLKKDDKFPNRQEIHAERIKQLENSIKGKFSECQEIIYNHLKNIL